MKEVQADLAPESAYCAYDTSLATDVSHAEIFQRVNAYSQELILARRLDLFSRMKPTFVGVQAFRQGLLTDLAPIT